MKITYDREADALYISFRETTVTTKHLAEGIAVDYDADGRLAGIEILDAIKSLGDPAVFKEVVLEDVAFSEGGEDDGQLRRGGRCPRHSVLGKPLRRRVVRLMDDYRLRLRRGSTAAGHRSARRQPSLQQASRSGERSQRSHGWVVSARRIPGDNERRTERATKIES